MTTTEAQKKARHTEGPWRKIGRAIVDQHGRVEIAVASTGDTGDTHVNENHRVEKGEAFANATLIASAPELLDACKYASMQVESRIGSESWAKLLIEKLEKAIANAEGGAQ